MAKFCKILNNNIFIYLNSIILLVVIVIIFFSNTVLASIEKLPSYRIDGEVIFIETDCYTARINTGGYVSGVAGGTFKDRKTGAVDLGHGLDVADFLMKPGKAPEDSPIEFQYPYKDKLHGNIPKQYIELPQICTQARRLPYQIVQGENFIALKQWYRWGKAAPGYNAGSLWEQYLVFPMGKRYFYSSDVITSTNDVEEGLIFRTDLPGHLKHKNGNNFGQIYLSYHGFIPNNNFYENFAPDERYLYQRDIDSIPERMIRAYQVSLNGNPGPFLAGMTLDPKIVYEAWCHQRDYVCFIQEIGGFPVKKGQSFSAVYIIGFFDSVEEMNTVYDIHKGWNKLKFKPNFKHARRFSGAR